MGKQEGPEGKVIQNSSEETRKTSSNNCQRKGQGKQKWRAEDKGRKAINTR